MKQSWIHYLPILTTLLSIIFATVLTRAYLARRTGPHLVWWAIGVFTYGLGTAVESTITLSGNSVELTKAWYIAGALLGGFPLAQGLVYLQMQRRTANILAWVVSLTVFVASLLVIASPAILSNLEQTRPTGAVLGWRWIRLVTPFVNLYSFVFLVGGAVMSARAYRRQQSPSYLVTGNILIAVGAILPGIGGSLAKAGIVEALYVLELLGLLLIWGGYGLIAQKKWNAPSVAQAT